MPILNDILTAVPSVVSHITEAPTNLNAGNFISGIDTNKGGALDPQNFIYNAAVILVWALGTLAVITFLYAGVKYITAGGDSEKAESAKKMMIGSVIGMLLVIGSYLIFNTAITVLDTRKTPKIETQQDVDQIMNQTYPTTP